MRIRKTIRSALPMLAVLAIGVILAAPADARFKIDLFEDRIEGSGDMETRSFDLDDFDRICLDGGIDLDIVCGRDHSVDVTLDDNLMENLVLEVRGKTLLIDWEEDCDPDSDSLIEIVMPELLRMKIDGAGDIEIHDLEGKRFEFELNGACDLDIDGRIETLEIDLSGAGDIDTRHLDAENVDVTISGAGDVDVTATESIEARISGIGRISYWGDPDREKTHVSGIGRIKRK